MYRCGNCGRSFDEPQYIERYAEDFFGVGSLFSDKHTITVAECPYCGFDDIIEVCEENEDDEDE